MTQKFKFGDRVKSRNKIGFVLRHSGNVYVAWEDGSQSTVAANKLTLIPHPDTVRLDFIQKNQIEIKLIESEDGQLFATETGGFLWEDSLSETVRQSIDVAIMEYREYENEYQV